MVDQLLLAVPVLAADAHTVSQLGPREAHVGLHALLAVQLRAQVCLVARAQRRRHRLARRRLLLLAEQTVEARRRRGAEPRRRVDHHHGAEGDPRAKGRVDGQLRFGVVVAQARRECHALHRDEALGHLARDVEGVP